MIWIKIEDETLKIEKIYTRFTTDDFLKILTMVTNNFYLDGASETFYINEYKFISFPDFVNSLTTRIE